MKFTYVNGDLFNVLEDLEKQGERPVAAHCIAADFGMSGGIAAQFVKRMNMRNLLHEKMKQEGVKVSPHPMSHDKGGYGNTYVGILGTAQKRVNVYNLITKQWTYEKPTYNQLIKSLESLKRAMRANNEHLLIIPKLGCGIDGLEWPAVSRLIAYTFGDTEIHVVVCVPHQLSDDPDKAWEEVFGTTYKGYQGEPLPG